MEIPDTEDAWEPGDDSWIPADEDDYWRACAAAIERDDAADEERERQRAALEAAERAAAVLAAASAAHDVAPPERRWLMSVVATHEAGHGVVAALIGVTGYHARLRANGGGVVARGPSYRSVPDYHLVMAAGYVAERLASVPALEAWHGARGDRANLETCYGEHLADLLPQVTRLLEQHWPAVEEVAAELVRRGHVSSRWIRRACRTARPAGVHGRTARIHA